MNLRDLKYLIAVAETRHFGRAAERCFLSQPTLSGQIKKLNEHLLLLAERHCLAEQAMENCHIGEREEQGELADLRASGLETLIQLVRPA